MNIIHTNYYWNFNLELKKTRTRECLAVAVDRSFSSLEIQEKFVHNATPTTGTVENFTVCKL